MSTDKKYLLRSMMFVPSHNDRLLNSASRSIADSLILDVEDSVMPVSRKVEAREKIVRYITQGMFKKFSVFPRINDKESGFLLKDLLALTIDGVDGFVYPKAFVAEDIYFIDKLLETIEYEKGFDIGKFKIIPLIETTSAVMNALEICKASNRVIAIAFGCEDFISDLEGVHDPEGKSLYVPRAMIAMAARAANVIPIDTVHIRIHDLEDFERNVILAKKLGFEGSLILHPKELEIAHRYFSPSEKEIKNAEQMLVLSDEAEKQNKGVAVVDNNFIGPPMVIAAKKIIERSRMIRDREMLKNSGVLKIKVNKQKKVLL